MSKRELYAPCLVMCFFLAMGWGVSQPRTKLEDSTLRAFETYVASVEAALDKGLGSAQTPVWITGSEPLNDGTIVVEQGQTPSVPSGLIHDWRGKMLVEGVEPTKVVEALRDYDRHADIYPEVVESRITSENGATLSAFLRLRKEQVLTVILNSEHAVEVKQPSTGGWHLRSRSTRIAEVRDYGKPKERELPVGQDSGFLWRLNAYWSVRGVEGGTLVELVTVSLSRDIPVGLGWLIKPFVTGMPRESLRETLQATRLALLK